MYGSSSATDRSGSPNLPLKTSLLLFLLALVLRLVVWFCGPYQDEQRAVRGDTPRYLVLAKNLRHHGTFGQAAPDGLVHRRIEQFQLKTDTLPPADQHGLRPELFRTPGYPAFLAAIDFFASDARAALFVQCILGALCAVFVANIALALGLPQRGALLAGFLWSVHPALVVYDNILLTESLFNSTLLLGLWLGIRLQSLPGWAASGLLIGLAGLIRPLALLYLPLAWLCGLRLSSQRLVTVSLISVMAVLPSVGWAARNHLVGNGFRLTTVSDVNLVYYLAAYSISEEKGEDWLASWPKRIDEISEKVDDQLQHGVDPFVTVRGVGYSELLARPMAVVRVLLKSLVKLFLDHSVQDMAALLGHSYQGTGIFSAILGNREQLTNVNWASAGFALAWSGLNVVLLLTAVWGAFRGFRFGLRGLALTCLFMIIGFAAATGAVGLERMRLPMFLPLFLLVGCAVPVRSWIQRSPAKQKVSRAKPMEAGALELVHGATAAT